MCIQNALQQHILDITNGGKDIAEFFYATMHGQNPNAKFHHQMDAAKHLSKLGLDDCTAVRPELVEGHSQEHTPSLSTAEDHDGSQDRISTPSPLTGEGRDGGENHQSAVNAEYQDNNPPNPAHPVKSAPVTDLDIINYKVACLIREETNDGYFIADFLARVMHGTAGQGRPISEADRLAAAKELMNRGLGRFGDTHDRRISGTQDDSNIIHSGLARYIRERTDQGLEPARFLLDVASGRDEAFSMHQRVAATRELVRRGWDTNYDRIKSEDIAAYYERQEAREPTGYDNRLQEWRENERAAREEREKQLEEAPQLEAGLFAHLSDAEIARYETMSAEKQADFIEQQRQRRATRQAAAAHQVIPSPSTEEEPAPSESKDRDGGENHIDAPSPSTGEGRDGGEDHENTNWHTVVQDINSPSPPPNPTHPVHPVSSQTRIRSP